MNDIPYKYYIAHIIILSLAAVAEIAFIVLFLWPMGFVCAFATCIFLGIFLLWPAIALLVGWIYVITKTRKRESWLEKVLFTWAIILALAVPLTSAIKEILNSQARYFYELPDNNTLTIWQNRIIFEKYTSVFPPCTNYIQLPGVLENWEMVIDTAGRTAVIMYNADEIKQFSPKYPLVATYSGEAGQYWFSTEFPPETWMLHCEYSYWPDAFSSGGTYHLSVVANDSVTHINGYYSFREYASYHQREPYTQSLDSLIISFHKKTDHYNHSHWVDSTQYSAFHKK